MAQNFIVRANEPDAMIVDLVGSNAVRMSELTRSGLPVPDWFAVNSQAFERFVRGHSLAGFLGEIENIELGDEQALGKFQIEAERRIIGCSVNPEIANAISATVKVWQASQGHCLGLSPIGYNEVELPTFPYMRSSVELQYGLKSAWACAFRLETLKKRKASGHKIWPLSQAVIVQRMIDGDYSGTVSVTESGSLSIQAVWGAAYSAARRSADIYRVESNSKAFTIETAEKAKTLRSDPDGGFTLVDVPAADQRRAILTKEGVFELVDLAKKLRGRIEAPFVFEWANLSGRFWILGFRA